MTQFGFLALALALTSANPAPPACADGQTIKAARLQEFQTMMMAVSLRCVGIGVDMQGDFEALLAKHQGDFSGAGRQVQGFFGATAKRGGAYDRYSVAVANKYGGGKTTPRNCKLLQKVLTELIRISDKGSALVAVTEAMIPRSLLEALVCPLGAGAPKD